MALTSALIYMNYQKALRQAQRLDSLAAELRNLANHNLDSTLTNVHRAWSGDSASLFLQKGVKAKEDMLKTAKSLQNTANAIRRAAQIVRAADLRALEIARRMGGR